MKRSHLVSRKVRRHWFYISVIDRHGDTRRVMCRLLPISSPP